MKKLKGEMDVEILKDTTDADNARVAKRRMGLCVMSASDQERFAYAPNESHLNENPAYPAGDDYGSMDKD